MKRILTAFLILLLLLCLVACKDGKKEESSSYEVTFSTALLPYTAAPPESLSVQSGETVSEPTFSVTPTAGYVVIWTTDIASHAPYDFSAPVTGDLTLYAVETPRSYSVTYLVRHGRNAAANPLSFTKETETVTLAKAVPDFGYHFLKWSYFDDPDSLVTEIPKGTENDVVLRAVIEPADYEILYYDAGDTNPNPAFYRFGTELDFAEPRKGGHRFLGYTIYMDGERTPVTRLTAEFVEGHQDALFKANGNSICLLANWEAE